jgi:hypothetical protein
VTSYPALHINGLPVLKSRRSWLEEHSSKSKTICVSENIATESDNGCRCDENGNCWVYEASLSCVYFRDPMCYLGSVGLWHHLLARPQVADRGDDLQLRRVAAYILEKQARTADKGIVLQLGFWMRH